MARVALKRKADASQTAATGRSKVPRVTLTTRKEIAFGHDDDIDELSQEQGSESSGMFVGQSPVKDQKGKQVQNARVPKVAKAAVTKRSGTENQVKSKRAGRVAKMAAEEEEDFGRTESQQFLEMVKYGSKKNKDTRKANEYLEGFKKHIKKEQDGLEILLEEKATEITTENDSFLAAFKSAYTSAMLILAPPPIQDSTEKLDALTMEPHDIENRLKKKSELVLKGASELISEYEKCEELLESLRGKVAFGGKWKDGIDKATRILEGGRLVGEKKVESVMIGSGSSARDEFAGGEMEVREGGVLYERETEVGAWAQVAKKQEKVVRKMTRLLPVE